MKKIISACSEMCASWATRDTGLFIMRVGVAIIFIGAGMLKYKYLNEPQGTLFFFNHLGFAPFVAYTVPGIEILAGVCMLLGVFVRYASAVLSIIMLVAIFKVKWANGLFSPSGYELDFILLCMLIGLGLNGSGNIRFIGR